MFHVKLFGLEDWSKGIFNDIAFYRNTCYYFWKTCRYQVIGL
ncbi:hypothetical protein TZ05_2805c [Listeria monocytogenes]|nr:hypothetical protein TZ05_2805c [Listeria monocytogenes]